MEITKRYKQTEIGPIPVDWEVKRLKEIGGFSKGQGIKKDQANTGSIPCVRYGELYTRHHDYIKRFYSFISKEVAITSKRLRRGDILFAGSGETKEDIGKSVAFIDDVVAYAGGDIIILSPSNVNSILLGFLLNLRIISNQKASRGQGDAVVHISATQLGNILVPLPPSLKEQTAIATALSDTDALINSLEKLIAKKRNIKQGAMQALLKPKKGWVVKRLGDILKKTQLGGNYQNAESVTQWPLIKMGNLQRGNISTNKIEYIKDAIPSESDRVNYGDLLFNTRNTLELVGKIAIWRNELPTAYFNSNLMRLTFLPNFVYSTFFMNYVLNRKDFVLKLREIATGTTSVAAIYTRDLNQLEVTLPPLEEQGYIQTILSDMDSEIQALESKLSKYKQIKAGMMQNLLTGKIRLL
jgi:type I restriction enzyme, S subunit